jgi:hypothetical protein
MDPDVWLTSNAWVVVGMLRDLAMAEKWTPPSVNIDEERRFEHSRQVTVWSLLGIITEMLDCTMVQSRDPETDLLRNHLDGSAAASAAYAFGDVARAGRS